MVQILPDRLGLGPSLPYIGQALAQGITGRYTNMQEQRKKDAQANVLAQITGDKLSPQELPKTLGELLAAGIPMKDALGYLKLQSDIQAKGKVSLVQQQLLQQLGLDGSSSIGEQPPPDIEEETVQVEEADPVQTMLYNVLGLPVANAITGQNRQQMPPIQRQPQPVSQRQQPQKQQTQQPQSSDLIDRIASIDPKLRLAASISPDPEDRRLAASLDKFEKSQRDKGMTEAQAEQARVANEKLNIAKAVEERAKDKYARDLERYESENMTEAQKTDFEQKFKTSKESAPYRKTIIEKADAARAQNVKLKEQARLARTGKLTKPMYIAVSERFGVPLELVTSNDTQLLLKSVAGNIQGVRQAVGGNISDIQLDAWMKQFPGIKNQPQAMELLINSLVLGNEMALAQEQALKEVFQENGGYYPLNTPELIAEKSAPAFEAIGRRFEKGASAEDVRMIMPGTQKDYYVPRNQVQDALKKGYKVAKRQ